MAYAEAARERLEATTIGELRQKDAALADQEARLVNQRDGLTVELSEVQNTREALRRALEFLEATLSPQAPAIRISTADFEPRAGR